MIEVFLCVTGNFPGHSKISNDLKFNSKLEQQTKEFFYF